MPTGMLPRMHRWARPHPSARLGALALLACSAAAAMAAGPPSPDPENGRAVYDTADMLSAEAETRLEERIDAIEAETGAEIVVYTQHDSDISEDENLANAGALIEQWGIGRSGFDDGLVLLVGLEDNRINGRVSMFGGSGFLRAYANEDDLNGIIQSDFVPAAISGDLERATV